MGPLSSFTMGYGLLCFNVFYIMLCTIPIFFFAFLACVMFIFFFYFFFLLFPFKINEVHAGFLLTKALKFS